MSRLDEIGIVFGTDKSRLVHDYLRQYERILSGFRYKDICLLEIGIHNGASLSVWKEFLPSAKIVGVDIEPATRRFADGRTIVEIGSQADAEFLSEVADRHLPDIIIDDGSHIEEHQIFTFGVLFPKLKPGGVYIVEDISSSVKSSAAEFYINLQREVLSRKGMQDISSIECIPGAVIIRKSINDELDYNINAIESIVLDAKSTDSSVYLAVYVMDKDLPFDRKVRVAQSAIRLNENNPWTYFNLGQIFAAYGHYQEAVTAVDQARAVALCVTPTFEEARARWIEALSDRAERASQPEAV